MQLPFAKAPQVPLADLWERALRAVAHPAGCMCRGALSLTPDPRIVEDNILDYLNTRYTEGGQARLAAMIEGRRAQLMSPAGHEPFAEWLERIGHLPSEDRDALTADLARVLESFEPLNSGALACY